MRAPRLKTLILLPSFVLALYPIQVNAEPIPGLKITVYDNFTGYQNFYNNAPPLPPTSRICLETIYARIAHNFDTNPICDIYDDFVTKADGYITAPETRDITLYFHGDDGVKLYLDDVLVVDAWYDSGNAGAIFTIPFTAEISKKLVAWHYENGGNAFVRLDYRDSNNNFNPVPDSWYTTEARPPPTTTTTSTSTTTTTTTSTTTIPETTTTTTSTTTTTTTTTSTTTTVAPARIDPVPIIVIPLPEPTTTISTSTTEPPATTSTSTTEPAITSTSSTTTTTITPSTSTTRAPAPTTTTTTLTSATTVLEPPTSLLEPSTTVQLPTTSADVLAPVKALTVAGVEEPITSKSLESQDSTYVEKTFKAIADLDLTPAEAAALIEIVENASPKVKEIFETKINVYSGSFDEYHPDGQNTTVRQRRALIAASGILSGVSMANLASGSKRRN